MNQVPSMSENPDAALREKVIKRAQGMTPEYVARAEYELEVIKDVSMSDYFLLIESITDYMNQNDIYFNTRGSANGSMVCYLLGITNADPIQFG